FGQLPSILCQPSSSPAPDCSSSTHRAKFEFVLPATTVADTRVLPTSSDRFALGENLLASRPVRKQCFHWKRALFESFTFFAIEQAYVVHDHYRWVTVENGIPFNHYLARLQRVALHLDTLRLG